MIDMGIDIGIKSVFMRRIDPPGGLRLGFRISSRMKDFDPR
jgi:hypothetical protein